ncbi:hypothetical protein AcW1_009325 [Taiwanofungus camphoratus]|nr:hypothetical protein AcW1_009325 [Antrodia cinnamomea]
MEQYLGDLKILIANILDIWVLIDPNHILVKPKLHVLPHVIEDIQRFGPPILYSTEIFECWNAIFRFCSILSNHQAPSHDIAITLADTERFKHQVSRGWWRNESGSVKQKAQKHRDPAPWQTASEMTTSAPSSDISDTETWSQCHYLVSQSKDICKHSLWVFFHQVQSETVFAGWITKILAPARTCDAVAIIDKLNISGERDPYLNMPILTHSGDLPLVVLPKDVLFIFNAQHDCHTAGCSPTTVQSVVQERLTTTQTRSAVTHTSTQRYFLNMHALHNTALIRETLPRTLTEPKPYLQDRLAKHHEIAAGLRVTGPIQRVQTIAKAADTGSQ